MSNGTKRGSSILAGLLLVLIGLLFLADIYRPELRLGHLIAVYWPVLLIVWGLAKILDYSMAHHREEPRPAILSGGEAALIIVMIIVLGGFVIRDWARDRVPRWNIDMPAFGPSYTRSEALPTQTIPANAHVAIAVPRGDISVQGQDGDQLSVSTQKTAWGMSQAAAERALQEAGVTINYSGGLYRIAPETGFGRSGRVSVDLAVQTPTSASVAASTSHGDVHIAGIGGSAQAHSGNGDVEVNNAGADVAINLVHGDAHVSGAAGNVTLTGRGDDVNVSDVRGDVDVQGAFDGTIHAQNVARTIRCALPWSKVTVAQLTGTLETDLGDLSVSGANGAVRVATHNTDIDFKNVAGPIDIFDTHGDIDVVLSAPPTSDINITNDSGDINVTLPANSKFQVAAISRGGDVDSDFDQLNVSNTDASGQITGHVGASGGPRITIATTYGTIHLQKGSSGASSGR